MFTVCRNSNIFWILHKSYTLVACYVTSVVSGSLRLYRQQPTRLLCLWDSPGKETGVGCHFFLQGTFLTQGWNPRLFCLLHWQAGPLPLAPPWEALWMYRVWWKEREMNEFCLNQGQKYSQESGYICVASWKRNRVSLGRNKYEGCSRQWWVHTKVWLWKAMLNSMEFNLKSTEGPTGTFKSRTVILKLINVAMKSLNTF